MPAACGRRFGKLTTAERRALPPSAWGLWSGKYTTSKYPMPDSSHASNAKARATAAWEDGYLTTAERRKIERKADRILKRCAAPRKRRSDNMARTAVTNRARGRDSRGRFKKGHGKVRRSRKRRKNPTTYGAARRRRNPLPAARRSRYSSTPGGYYRRPNPSLFKMDTWTKVMPAAAGGVALSRWAVKMAGPFTPDAKGVPVPGFEHAIAVALGLQVAAPFIGRLLGGSNPGAATDYAQIAGLGYMGDLFLRTRFLREQKWFTENISLEGTDAGMAGFQQSSALGAVMYDASGNKYIATQGGWQLAQADADDDDDDGEYVMHPSTGEVYEVLEGGEYEWRAPSLDAFYSGMPADASTAMRLEQPAGTLPQGGFTQHTPLGRHGRTIADDSSSFGYRAA